MAKDVFTEVTRTGLGSRLGGSFKGILVGLILAAVSFPLLFWNEGRAVERYKTLQEGEGVVVTIQPSEVQAEHQGKLVHFSGLAASDETLRDETFGITSDGLRLLRKVEMYQWQEETRTETKTNTGGSQTKTTTYEYETGWSSGLIDSSGFRYPEGHDNPKDMPIRSDSRSVSQARIGRVNLPQSLLEGIGRRETLSPQGANLPDIGRPGRIAGDQVYFGGDPANPQVGDLRVRFQVVPETNVSVVAQLQGDSLTPYQTSAGGSLFMIDDGIVSAQQMFASEHQANTFLTWILRVVGFVLMWIGLASLFGPLAVISDVIPLVGRLVGAGIGLVTGLLALALSGVTIAIAWFFYRPLLAIAVLAVSAGAIYLIGKRSREATPVTAGPAAAPPPPPPA